MTLKEKRDKLWQECLAIVAKADSEGREMNEEEERQFDLLYEKRRVIKRRIRNKGFMVLKRN